MAGGRAYLWRLVGLRLRRQRGHLPARGPGRFRPGLPNGAGLRRLTAAGAGAPWPGTPTQRPVLDRATRGLHLAALLGLPDPVGGAPARPQSTLAVAATH